MSALKYNEDPSLWQRFKNGDRDAFSFIYREYTICLLQYGYKFCANREKLQDIVHDLFVELWNSRQSLSDTDSIKFYLCKSLKYKLLRANNVQWQTGRQLRRLFSTAEEPVETPVDHHIIAAEIHDSRSELLSKAIQKLSRRQQEIIMLRFYMGFSNAQIAELMHMKYQSVSNLLHSALGRIRDTLQTAPFVMKLIETLHIFF